MVFTQIYPEYPGYTWILDEIRQEWKLEWNPIPNIYSPPQLMENKIVKKIPIQKEVQEFIGNIIGKDGRFMKWITQKSNTFYIFYRHGSIEIWGSDEYSVQKASLLLHNHIQHHLEKRINISN